MSLRVLLVDDSPAFLRQAEAFLAEVAATEVVGSALSARRALELLEHVEADVVIVDLLMPGTSGLELIRSIKADHPALTVVVATLHDDPEYAEAALAAGAEAFIPKAKFAASLPSVLDSVRGRRGETG